MSLIRIPHKFIFVLSLSVLLFAGCDLGVESQQEIKQVNYSGCIEAKSNGSNKILVTFADSPEEAERVNIYRDGKKVFSTTQTDLKSFLDEDKIVAGQVYDYSCEVVVDGNGYIGGASASVKIEESIVKQTDFEGCDSAVAVDSNKVEVGIVFPQAAEKVTVYRNGQSVFVAINPEELTFVDKNLSPDTAYTYHCEAKIDGELVIGPHKPKTSTNKNINPFIEISEPDNTNPQISQRDGFEIKWVDADLDHNAKIDLYFIANNTDSCRQGSAIKRGIREDDEAGSGTFAWDTTNAPPGTYYICGVIDDGFDPSEDFSFGTLTIDGTPGFEFVAPAPEGDEAIKFVDYRISWTDSDADQNSTIDLYYSSTLGTDCSAATPIATGIAQSDPTNYFDWSTSAIAIGSYYLCSVIKDSYAEIHTWVESPVIISDWVKQAPADLPTVGAQDTRIALHPDTGHPVLAYSDTDDGDRLKVFEFDGTNWAIAPGGTAPSTGAVEYLSIAFHPITKDLYAAYKDFDLASDGIMVMRHDGSDWSTVALGGLPTGTVNYVNLAFDSLGNAHLAFQDMDTASDTLKVMKFNGATWSEVGGSSGTGNSAEWISLAISSNDEINVAFDDGADNKITLRKFVAGVWGDVGNTNGLSSNPEYVDLALKPDDDRPYVAYRDGAGDLFVSTYNGTNWSNVLSPGDYADDPPVSDVALAFSVVSNLPFVTFKDHLSGFSGTVLSFDGTTWSEVGRRGYSNASASDNDLVISPDGIPFTAYTSGASNDPTVSKYTSSP